MPVNSNREPRDAAPAAPDTHARIRVVQARETSGRAPHRHAPEPVPAVAAQNVSLVLGASPILHDVSFSVPTGQVVALMGANGSGKSTLVRTLLGVYRPTEGSVEILGYPQGHPHMPFDHIGYVPQRVTPRSGVPATALEVVRSGLLSRGHLFADRGRKAKAKALAALTAVGLDERAHDHVHVFSGGQAQRLAIARALVRNPAVLFLDEPLAGVDVHSRTALAQILSKLKRDGVTQLIVLHETEELTPLLDRVIYLENGQVIYDGTPVELPRALEWRHAAHHRDPLVQHHAPKLTGE
ncbi:MAG: metal ABC transporter ATP-binding protein [Arcanobacterium sp.]|nr:metal ABC transporter ATP-binding protein [Arcanobacterium sp.]